MFKVLNDKRGSALTYVLIIMMLLSILSLSIISSTVINYTVNRQSNAFNKSFYITDGAIDETLAELREITYRAEVYASNWINDPLADFRQETKWLKFLSLTNSRLESGELTSEESVSLTQLALEREFTKRYYMFLLEDSGENNKNTNQIFEEIDGDYSLYDEDGDFIEESNIKLKEYVKLKDEYLNDLTQLSFRPSEDEKFSSASIDAILIDQENHEDYFSLTIRSNGSYNEYKKAIELKLDIVKPNYNFVISTDSKKLTIHKNQGLTNALMARKDIIILEGSVRVNGDIYAYGSFPNVAEYRYSDLGGVLIGADRSNLNSVFTSIGEIDYMDFSNESISGRLSVDGDIKSRSSVRINGDFSKLDSTLSVYANSFVVDKDADDFTASIGRNLYMMEDMILLGDNSKLNIGKSDDLSTGELWTFLEGSPSGTNRNVRDLSGSIIIDNNSENLNITTNNYFISGVAYIDIYRMVSDVDGDYRSYYQSGESLTTNNYNNYYTKKMASTDKSTKHFDYSIASGSNLGDTVKVVETYETIAQKDYVKEDVNYKSTHFISKNNEIESGYENSFAPISNRDKSILTINSLLKENKNNNYALGVILGNSKVFNPYSLSSSDASTFVNMPFNDFVEKHRNKVSEIDKKINTLATRDYSTSTNTDEKFDEFFRLDSSTDYTSIGDTENFIFINSNPNKDIYLNISPSKALDIKDKNPQALTIVSDTDKMTLNGVIITKGNIIVYNQSNKDFVFNGPLISDQNILMYGSGSKIINNKIIENSYNSELIKAIIRNNSLYNASNSETGKKLEVQNARGSTFPSRSIDGNLKIDIVDNEETIDKSINSNVILEGIIKTDKAKTIVINSWKEVDNKD